ncbi:MAG: tetratricopeptide repeat protein [Thalassobaculaceae bacterium]
MAALAVTAGLSWLWPRLAEPPTRFHVARQLLTAGDGENAAVLFAAPAWRGAALYSAGQYRRALVDFFAGDTVADLYNTGNAYAQLHEWRAAKEAYRQVLELAPDHADARHNLAVVRRAEARERALLEASRTTKKLGKWRDGSRNAPPDDSADTPAPTETGGAGENETRPSDGAATLARASDQGVPQSRPPTGGDGAAGRAAGRADQDAPDNLTGRGGAARTRQADRRRATLLLRQVRDDPARVLAARLAAIHRRRQDAAR